MWILHWFYRPSHRTCDYYIGFIDRATEIVEKPLVLQAKRPKKTENHQKTFIGNPFIFCLVTTFIENPFIMHWVDVFREKFFGTQWNNIKFSKTRTRTLGFKPSTDSGRDVDILVLEMLWGTLTDKLFREIPWKTSSTSFQKVFF